MAKNWTKITVGDLCNTISNTYQRDDKEVVLINTSDVLNGTFLNCQPVANKNLKGQFKKTFQKNDILYSEIRPANKRYAFVDFDKTENYIASTKLMVLRPNSDVVRPRFLYAFLTSDIVIKELQQLAEARSGTFPQITFNSELAPISINLPDLKTQDKIVEILSAFEKKISINNEINKNLEQQAITLFNALFKTRENKISSILGNIPESFTICKIRDIPMLVTDYVANGSFATLRANVHLYQEKEYAYFIRNTDLKSDSFSVYVDKHSYDFLSKSALYGGEIIISNVGDVGSVFLCPTLDKPMTLGNNIIMLKPENDQFRLYLYLWFKFAQGKALIDGIKGGSAQPKFNKTDFRNLPIALPSSKELEQFNKLVSPIFKLINRNKKENKKLVEARDLLLPKLLSGEIDVSKVNL